MTRPFLPVMEPTDSDEPQTPPRSPSRLDFCLEDDMDWACSFFPDDYPYTLIDEETFTVDIQACLPITEEDDSPPASAHDPEQTDVSRSLSECPTDQVVVEPKAPTPVRPLSVQFRLDSQEDIPSPRTAPQRLNYPHRGFSRSALLQQKILWNSRYEEWLEWQSCMEKAQEEEGDTDGAYTGVTTNTRRVVEGRPPYMRTPPSGLERDLANHPSRNHEQDVPASIYPRVGDISALRDPYSAKIDRCFFRYPLWTLRKTLYVFNMHQRVAPSAHVDNTSHVSVSASSSTLSSYTSSIGYDQESDSTLIADDSPTPESPACASPPHTPPWNRFCRWELSWYARWELLIGLFQRDSAKCDTFDISMTLAASPEPKAPSPSPSRRIFRFTIGDEDEDEEDEDDDDYGALITNPSFSADFDEECVRAMAFYSRELGPVMVL